MSESLLSPPPDTDLSAFLPSRPEDWTFVVVDHCVEQAEFTQITGLGFKLVSADAISRIESQVWAGRVVLLASTSWLQKHGAALHSLLPRLDASVSAAVLVALTDLNEISDLARARQAGARLLFPLPLHLPRLLAELAGLAWLPCSAYRVLLLDDDPVALRAHESQLREAGCRVLALADPLSAQRGIAAFTPDVCVFDVEMPACRGTDLAALIRRERRFAQLPIVYLSAWDNIQHHVEARQAGGEDYLVKPVDGRLLTAAVISRARLFRLQGLASGGGGRPADIAIAVESPREPLERVNLVLRQYILDGQAEAALRALLEEALRYSGSARGFLAEIRSASTAATRLVIHGESGWPGSDNLPEVRGRALYAALETTRGAVEPAAGDALKPPGIDTLLCLPLMNAGRIAGLLTLADRAGGYGEAWAANMRPLIEAAATILADTGDEPSKPIPAAPPQAIRYLQRGRILVAEDNAANQAVLRMQLGVLGHDCTLVADGRAALATWQLGGFDLLLLDRNMPGLDGLSLTRVIRGSTGGGDIPIIAITALDQPEDVAQCLDAGMNDVLAKPIELDDLRRMLNRWLPGIRPPGKAKRPLTPDDSEIPVLDRGQMLRVTGDAAAAQWYELVALFCAGLRKDLPACQACIERSDGQGLGLLMHRHQSSARIVGAMRCAALAEQLKNASLTGLPDSTWPLLQKLESAIAEVERALPVTLVQAAPAPITRPAPAGVPHRVLVVGDEPLAIRHVSLLLASLGVTDCMTMENARQALNAVAQERNRIDLIVADLHMHQMDGIEFLRHLAETSYRGGLILMSGVEERLLHTISDLMRAKGLRLHGCMSQPMTRDDLAALLIPPGDPDTTAREAEAHEIWPEDILEGLRHNEFSIHFQPKAEAQGLRVVGVEALARWRHAGQDVPPDQFIPVAEQHGLIGPLSEILLTRALNGGWRIAAAGYPLTLSVNLSPHWLSNLKLPEFILASLNATGFPPERLILEMTETAVIADQPNSLDVLTRLRLKGFKLSIDDFGTGYSSLEQLQRIPFGEIKLDRGFVRSAGTRPAAHAVLASSIAIARQLRLTSVAEGVETEAELDLVRQLGADQIQGWLLARAMPVEELITWLRQRPA